MGKKRHVSLSPKDGLRVKDDGTHDMKLPPPPVMFVVYYAGPPRGRSTIIKLTPDRKSAEEAAERFVLENGGLKAWVVEFAALSAVEFPKKETENG